MPGRRRARSSPLDIPIPGVRIEDLSGAARLLEPQRFSIEPGQGSGGEYTHEGEEFLYVLEGTLSITLDRREHFDVHAGMSLCFESTRRHRWWNPGDGRDPGALDQHAAQLLTRYFKSGVSHMAVTVRRCATSSVASLVETRGGGRCPLVDPSTGEVFAHSPLSSAEDVDDAYRAARERVPGVA